MVDRDDSGDKEITRSAAELGLAQGDFPATLEVNHRLYVRFLEERMFDELTSVLYRASGAYYMTVTA